MQINAAIHQYSLVHLRLGKGKNKNPKKENTSEIIII